LAVKIDVTIVTKYRNMLVSGFDTGFVFYQGVRVIWKNCDPNPSITQILRLRSDS